MQFSPEHNKYILFFVPNSKTDEQHNFAWFYRRVTTLCDGFLTDYHWKWRHNDVTTRSVNHFDDDVQLSTKYNVSKTLADCYIDCTVYNDLQLFYKEKVKKDIFYTQGFTNCKPLEIRCKQIICTAKGAFWYSFVSWF